MASKTTQGAAFTAAQSRPTQDLEIEIDGLVAGETDGTFRLLNVPIIEVDWPKVAEVLIAAGLPDRTAREYADEFASTVFRKEIARLLCDRMTRY